MKHSTITSLLLLPLLASCGGSSSQTSDTPSPTVPTPTPSTPTSSQILVVDDTIKTNQATDLILQATSGETITNIHWQQTSGPTVNLVTQAHQTLAFTPTQAGEYQFSVSYTSSKNGAQTQAVTLTVEDNNALISARLGQTVIEGNKVSLRAWVDPSVANATVTWQQIQGPEVSYQGYQSGDLAIVFNAPYVTEPSILKFTASISVNGTKYQDNVAVLVNDGSPIASSAYFDTRVAQVHPYHSNSPYADNLVRCVYSNTLTSSCTLGELPLLAQQTTEPSVDDIMNRVVVSHQWMGDRFKEFLQQDDVNNDFKQLLRATTAVVIAYDVRPSFYWAATGAIYLDPSNFWLTPDERDTINEAPDYRADFGNDLQFVMPWRYVKNNDYAYRYYANDTRVTRTSADRLYRLSSLLYHELAHANDFFPASEWFSHNTTDRILDAALATNFESDLLDAGYPLQSQTMRDLAQVSFHGASATNTQKAYQPHDVSGFFSPDGATDFYNFSTIREDYAMLFEELMMQSRYGIQRDVAVTNQPQGDVVYANDYIVDWGQRGRVGEANIKPRALFVANRVLPEFNAQAALDNLPAPIAMISGRDWIQNLALSAKPNKANQSAKRASQIMRDLIPRLAHKNLPKH